MYVWEGRVINAMRKHKAGLGGKEWGLFRLGWSGKSFLSQAETGCWETWRKSIPVKEGETTAGDLAWGSEG